VENVYKILHFAANLFRKRCTKFHQNDPSFMEDITKIILVSFFGHSVHVGYVRSQMMGH